jgi:hypothetical protein
LSLLIAAGGSLAAALPADQDPTLAAPAATASGPGTAEEAAASLGSFGLLSQDHWMGATEFVPRSGGTMTYNSFYYWNTSNSQMEGQVLLPAGARVTILECFFRDADPTDGTIGFWRQSYNYATDSPSVTNVTTVSSSGTGGYQKPFQTIDETIRYRNGDLRNIYTLIWTAAASNPNLTFRGCRFFWNRQVTPAPAAASFTDVPTTHPQFRFVEAMVAAGITGGCGTGIFCPDANLTRGQMAVFLSAALGLHWPF